MILTPDGTYSRMVSDLFNVIKSRHMGIKNREMRHNWSPKVRSRSKENSSTQCTRCGAIRQYVGGIATYFLNDTVRDRYAGACSGEWLANNSDTEIRDLSAGVYGIADVFNPAP